MSRYTNDVPVFGVHFTFPVLAGRELYTQPLMLNNNQPDLINFNKFTQFEEKKFNPKSKDTFQSYHMLDQNGYVFHNQYPSPRQDVKEAEGNHRFNMGVEYPWYQRAIGELVSGTQYEYLDLNQFLLKCARGFAEFSKILASTIPEEATEAEKSAHLLKQHNAAAKGKALHELYARVLREFCATYPEYNILAKRTESGEIVNFVFELTKTE